MAENDEFSTEKWFVYKVDDASVAEPEKVVVAGKKSDGDAEGSKGGPAKGGGVTEQRDQSVHPSKAKITAVVAPKEASSDDDESDDLVE